jgi:hypothetical protein
MPLSNEEAQQLIAEIENLDVKYCTSCRTNSSYQERKDIIKIITRFANKPPFILSLGNEYHYI